MCQEKMLDTSRLPAYDRQSVIREGRAVEQIVEQGILYDFYGPLLTRHQQEIYELVVYQNLSLNEIAEQRSISKQAVSDLVRRATAQMQEYEKRLGLIERFRRIQRLCDALDQASEDLSQDTASGQIRTLTQEIRREL